VTLRDMWPAICKLCRQAFFSALHLSLATINADGTPHLAPIGSIILDPQEPKGFFFETYTIQTSANLNERPQFSLLAMNSYRGFWLRALLRRRLVELPSVRLTGIAGARRKATIEEVNQWNARIRHLRWLPGGRVLWAEPIYVRDLTFLDYEPVRLGKMTNGILANNSHRPKYL
jgi:uncharacterized protein